MFVGGLGLSKEVLWVSVGQTATKLHAAKLHLCTMCGQPRMDSKTMGSSSKFGGL